MQTMKTDQTGQIPRLIRLLWSHMPFCCHVLAHMLWVLIISALSRAMIGAVLAASHYQGPVVQS